MTRFNMQTQTPQPQTPQPPLRGAAPVATVPEGFPEGKQSTENSKPKTQNSILLPVPCRSMAWFLNDQRRPEQARVDRIEITHIAKPNVYGNECEWNERIVYFVGRCQRLSTEVFATKEELINSLML